MDYGVERRMVNALLAELEQIKALEWSEPSQLRLSDILKYPKATTVVKHCFYYLVGTRFPFADMVIGIDFDGSLFGYALANEMEMGFAPMRKIGQAETPGTTVKEFCKIDEKTIGYELDVGALSMNRKCVVIDGILMTEKINVADKLIGKLDGTCIGAVGLMELKEHPITPLDFPMVAFTLFDWNGNFSENVAPFPPVVVTYE